MKLAIRAILTATCSVLLALGATAQTKTTPAATSQAKGSEKTVEEAYLQESAEAMMVTALSHMDDLEAKQEALKRVKKALDEGRKNEDIRKSLAYLALENTQYISRNAGIGAPTNNFPIIRKDACKYLGEFPSVETKDTLVSVILNSKAEDPMVLAEAILSLGKIGINDNDEVILAIAYSVNHFDKVGMSEDRLAEYTMTAILQLAEKNKGIKDIGTVTDMLMKFTRGNYTSQVRSDALATLDKLAQYQVLSSAPKK